MTPTTTILDKMAALLAADASTLAPAALALKVHLAIAAFTPGNALVPGSFTEATYVGYAPVLGGVGACQNFVDPATGLRTVQLNEPAGGWHFACTGGAGLPQTVYGYYVTDNGTTVVYGSQLLPTPVVISASGQALDLPQVRFNVVQQPLN